MSGIEVYSSLWCPFCARAKALLDRKGVEYREIDVDRDPNLRQQMMQRAGGRRTVPQIFVDGRHVGGSDDLAALERAGELDALLGIG
ncbi:MAG: glutaredoxin 3 [Defluviicoccus sp.]|nr:glutaredoxin 3 [Defluviicoccus sp.]MDE0274497.1 glutaredoxin 3 [Defluviicoccus sp.]